MNGVLRQRPKRSVIALLAVFTCTQGFASANIADQNTVPKRSLAPSSSEEDQAILDTSRIHTLRFAIVSGALLGGMAAIHVYQSNGWWKNNRRSFHFQEDLKYGLSVDKIGHFYGATAMTFIMAKSFQWANLSEKDALWMGAGASLLFLTFLEIEDGFSTWGFDRVDFATDVAGAAWPIARYHVPFLQNFDFKFSYRPSPLLDNPGGVGFQGQRHIMFDDYEGQTLWLGIKVGNLIPDELKSYWPEFLGLAVGYGVRDVASSAPKSPHSVVYIGLDLDVTKIIPRSSPFLRTLGEALNFFRLPLPTVRIAPSTIWYGAYF